MHLTFVSCIHITPMGGLDREVERKATELSGMGQGGEEEEGLGHSVRGGGGKGGRGDLL